MTLTRATRWRAPVLLIPLLLLTSAHVSAQAEGWEKQGKGTLAIPSNTGTAERESYVGPQPFDVVHYDLDLRFAMETPDMGGTVTMTLVPAQTITALTLNAADLQIDSIRVNGIAAASPGLVTGEQFTLVLPEAAAAGDTLRVAISYQRPPAVNRSTSRQGYFYFVPDSAGLLTLPDTIGYTMSEPLDARFWLPCYDEPWDKATAEIRATIPRGFIAASNGILLDTIANSDGTVTWHWREDHQIATYLLAVTISRWTVSTQLLTLGTGKVIPVQYYVWKEDSAACAAYLPTVAQMITTLGALFGPYPFDKYGMTGVAPFLYGGMEHQTITTLAKSLVTDEAVVVHELGHQWWGDNVTCATWPDIWLNESFASYVEALWRESLGGHAELVRYMKDAHEHFNLSSWSGAVYDPQGQGFDLFANSVYSKGAWVLHTLRGVLGDTLFFSTLRAYRTKYQGSQATTDEFRAVADSISHQDMRWFFDEWIYGKGFPQYAVQSHYGNGTLSLTVYQQQDASWPTFRMPVQVKAVSGVKDTTFTILDSARVQNFTEALTFSPDTVIFDPDSWILKQMVVAPATSAPPPATAPLELDLEQNFPNPFNPKTVIRCSVPPSAIQMADKSAGRDLVSNGVRDGQWTGDSKVRLVVYDLLGRQVAVLANGRYPAGRYSFTFDGTGFASGVYLYRLIAENFVATRAMLLLK
ncbi:MAG: M1 family aminopeptidase [Bacteroidota bacterium]